MSREKISHTHQSTQRKYFCTSSKTRLALDIRVDQEIILGKRRITSDTA